MFIILLLAKDYRPGDALPLAWGFIYASTAHLNR